MTIMIKKHSEIVEILKEIVAKLKKHGKSSKIGQKIKSHLTKNRVIFFRFFSKNNFKNYVSSFKWKKKMIFLKSAKVTAVPNP